MELHPTVNQLFKDLAKENNILVEKCTISIPGDSATHSLNRLLDVLLGLPSKRKFAELELTVLYNYMCVKIYTGVINHDLLSDLKSKCLAVINRIIEKPVSSVGCAFQHVLGQTDYGFLSSLASMTFCLLGVCYSSTGDETLLNCYFDTLDVVKNKAIEAKDTLSLDYECTLTNYHTVCTNHNNWWRSWSWQLAYFMESFLQRKKNSLQGSEVHNAELAPHYALMKSFMAIRMKNTLSALKELNTLKLDKELSPELQSQVCSYSAYCASMLGKHHHAIRLYKDEIKLTRSSCDVIFNISLQYRLTGEKGKELAALEDLVQSFTVMRNTPCMASITVGIDTGPLRVRLDQGTQAQLTSFQSSFVQAARLCELGRCDQALEKFKTLLGQLENNEERKTVDTVVDINDVFVKAALCACHSDNHKEFVLLIERFEKFMSSGSQVSSSQSSSAIDLDSVIDLQEMLTPSESVSPNDAQHVRTELDRSKCHRKQTNRARVLLMEAEFQALSGDIQKSILFIDNAISLIEDSIPQYNQEHTNKRQKMEAKDRVRECSSPELDLLLAGAYSNKSMAYASLQQYAEAYRYSKKAVEISPLDDTFAYNHVLLLYCLGEDNKARKFWQRFRNIASSANHKDSLKTRENFSVLQNVCLSRVPTLEKGSANRRQYTVTNRELTLLDLHTQQEHGD